MSRLHVCHTRVRVGRKGSRVHEPANPRAEVLFVRHQRVTHTLAIARSISDLRQPRRIRSCSSVTRRGAHTDLPAYSRRRSLLTTRRTKPPVAKFIASSSLSASALPLELT